MLILKFCGLSCILLDATANKLVDMFQNVLDFTNKGLNILGQYSMHGGCIWNFLIFSLPLRLLIHILDLNISWGDVVRDSIRFRGNARGSHSEWREVVVAIVAKDSFICRRMSSDSRWVVLKEDKDFLTRLNSLSQFIWGFQSKHQI